MFFNDLLSFGIVVLQNVLQGRNYDATIEYPDSFNVRDTDKEYAHLAKAKEIATDPRIIKLIDEDLLELMDREEEDLGEHPVTTVENRNTHIQQMIMEGYTDEQILEMHSEITQQDINSAKQQLLDENNNG